MNERLQPAQSAGAGVKRARIRVCWTTPAMPRGGARLAGALVLALCLSGCRHKTLWVPPASVTAPVELDVIPPQKTQPVIAELPPPELIPVRPPEPQKKPARKKAAQAKDAAQTAPVQVASAGEPASLAIGSLSTGGDGTSQTQQQARDLIASIHKRIAALPRSALSQQKAQLRQVNSFLKQSQQALDSGDAEGAMTLATKARLLMDDIEKK